MEARVRGADALGRGRAVERREPLPRKAPDRYLDRTLVQHLLRVRCNGLPPPAGAEARPGEGFRY